MAAHADLSLAESVCLTLVAHEPTHGWSIVKALAPDGEHERHRGASDRSLRKCGHSRPLVGG